MRHRRVMVVGDLVTDVVVLPSAALTPATDTPGRVRLSGGGQAANTAAWLAAVDVPVTLVAVVGDDSAGHQRRAELTGVDLAVRVEPEARTGAVLVLSHDGERTMVNDRGAAAHLRPGDIDEALDRFPDTAHLHLSGYVLLEDESRAAGRHALAVARARGLTSSVDAASAAPLRAVRAADFLDWVAGVDLLLANADEARVLAGDGPGSGGSRALAGSVTAVVVKHGAAGASWFRPDGTAVRADSVRTTVIDPTGAGDAFAAGLLGAWLAGADPAAALAAGVRLGARAVGTVGARP